MHPQIFGCRWHIHACVCRTVGGLLVKSRVQRHDAMEAVAPKEDPEALAAASKKRKKKVRHCRETPLRLSVTWDVDKHSTLC